MKKYLIWLLFGFALFVFASITFAAEDIMETMFAPAKLHEGIVDLGATKNDIGREVFSSSTNLGLNVNFGGCFVNGGNITKSEMQNKIIKAGSKMSVDDYCKNILGGSTKTLEGTAEKQPPLIVRITKFLLRITIVLSITMILYNGLLWIIESSKGAEIKDAKNNLIYIIVGVLLSLFSVALINLISSLGMSSLDPQTVIKESINIHFDKLLSVNIEKNYK